ncbi:MAG TPA: ABC transporter permease [Anaerolineae bacterium]|jgi:ABC-2 type transport system permease protein|nr:ABC transporter permease [Anaerolineae bacterium]
MNALNITRKDLLILVKDVSTMLQLFLLPLVFIVLYVGIGSNVAAQSADEAQRPSLPVANEDTGGDMAEHLIKNLESQGGLNVEPYGMTEAQILLADEEISRLLIIPAGFSASVAEGTPATLSYTSLDQADTVNQSVQLSVEGVVRDLSLQTLILGSLTQMRDMQAGNSNAEEALTADKAVAQARSQFESSATRPLVTVQEELPSQFQEREEDELSFAELAVPSMTVLFVFLTAQTTAQSIYEEKKIGSFRRLLAAPLSRFSLMSGKLTPNFLVVILQVVVIFFAAIVIFPLLGMDKLTLGNDPVALVLLVLFTALCSTTLGALIVSLAHTEAQIGGLSTAALWVMAFVGGTIVPLFLVSDALAAIGKVTPQYWAVTGFYDLLVRGQGLSDITDSLLALLGFSVLFMAIALWRFDFD